MNKVRKLLKILMKILDEKIKKLNEKEFKANELRDVMLNI